MGIDSSTKQSSPARWRWVVGIGLLVALVVAVGPSRMVATFAQVSLKWTFVTLLVAMIWLFLGGLKGWLLLRTLAPIRLSEFLATYVTSWAVSQLIPGQLGDATQVVLLKRYQIPVESGSAAYLVDKFISLSWMLTVAAYGIVYLTASVKGWLLLTLPIVGVFLAALGVWTVRRIPTSQGGWLDKIRGLVDRSIDQLFRFTHYPGRIALNIALTISKWATVGLKYFCAFLAFGTPVGFPIAWTAPVMSSLVGYIPITVGGAGTTELTAVVLFGKEGAAAATVVGVYIFLRGIMLLAALTLVLSVRLKNNEEERGLSRTQLRWLWPFR